MGDEVMQTKWSGGEAGAAVEIMVYLFFPTATS